MGRTVKCESPNCGAEIPLARSLALQKKTVKGHCATKLQGNRWATYRFEIFEPELDSEVPKGSVSRAKATCLCCGTILPPERVRAQLTEQRGGADVIFDQDGNRVDGARLLAVVTLRPGEQGRHYRLPEERDYAAVRKAQKWLAKILSDWELGGKQGLCPSDDHLRPIGAPVLVQRMVCFNGVICLQRQKLTLVILSNITKNI